MLRRHRIEAIAMQRMTPQEPAYCHDRAPQRSVLGNRNGRILRTCRLEPACDWRSSSRMHDWRNHVLMKCKKSADASISRLRQPLCRMRAHRLPSAPPATFAKMRATSRSSRANFISSTVFRG
jgi:hypothetical protein